MSTRPFAKRETHGRGPLSKTARACRESTALVENPPKGCAHRVGLAVTEVSAEMLIDGIEIRRGRTAERAAALPSENREAAATVLAVRLSTNEAGVDQLVDHPAHPRTAQDGPLAQLLHAESTAGRVGQFQQHVVPAKRKTPRLLQGPVQERNDVGMDMEQRRPRVEAWALRSSGHAGSVAGPGIDPCVSTYITC
jgi:hypothetical protein